MNRGNDMEELKNRLLHNVKDYKRLICIALCAVMALMLIGCCAKADAAEQTLPLKIWGQNTNGCYYTLVVVDEETGVNYVVVSAQNYSNAITIAISPRYNADGTLYVTK